jgi:hypothetical protein
MDIWGMNTAITTVNTCDEKDYKRSDGLTVIGGGILRGILWTVYKTPRLFNTLFE